MIQLALKLASRTIASLKVLAGTFIEGLTGTAYFPTPTTTPAMIEAAVEDVTTAENELASAEQTVVAKRNALDQKVQALKSVLTNVGLECLDKVKNDPEPLARTKLLSAKLILKSDGAPTEDIAVPENFGVTRGDHTGAVDGGCNKVPNAKMYRVRVATNLNGPWETKYEGTRSSFTIQGLAPGVTFFQMAAFGVNGGWSEWCDTAILHVV